MSGASARGGFLLALTVLLALVGKPDSAWAGTGWVEVHVTDHRAGIGDFKALLVELAEVSLHPAARPRGKGWVEVVRRARAVDIVPLKDGLSVSVGSAIVSAARYDAVRVRFGNAQGALRSAGLAEVVSEGSAVAVNLVVERGTTRVVLIDLYVEDQTDHRPGQYALKVRDVRIEQP